MKTMTGNTNKTANLSFMKNCFQSWLRPEEPATVEAGPPPVLTMVKVMRAPTTERIE